MLIVVASLCMDMNYQGRKVLGVGKVRNLQGTEKARQDKLESARIGNNCKVVEFCREMESSRNGISKELNLQRLEFGRNGICK